MQETLLTERPDLERRFGGLSRLYGAEGASRIRHAHVVVVGVGGVGSWAAEALARSGVARLTLIDLDHVAESNINRQVQASSPTLGQAKVLALAERIATIHPGCRVDAVEEFVGPDNWPLLLPHSAQAVLDACDQVRAKVAMAAWARQNDHCHFIAVGAAGGKQRAHRVEVADLSRVTHDPLLAQVRQRLRKLHGAPREGRRLGVECVYSTEPVTAPVATVPAADGPGQDTVVCAPDATLNCHGYGSVVSVTATFGMVAAGELLRHLAGTATASAAARPPHPTLASGKTASGVL